MKSEVTCIFESELTAVADVVGYEQEPNVVATSGLVPHQIFCLKLNRSRNNCLRI